MENLKIKDPDFKIIGPKNLKLWLKFAPEHEACRRNFFIYILMDDAPW